MKYLVFAMMLFTTLLTFANEGESKADSISVEYVVAKDQPSMNDAQWVTVSATEAKEEVIDNIPEGRYFWIRASTKENPDQWVVYGPLVGEDQQIDVIPIGDDKRAEYVQFDAQSSPEKLKCCKVRVRVRVRLVVKTPNVTVRNPVPEVTVRWRGPIPSVTVRGPDIVVKDLPRIPEVDSPIPVSNLPTDVGMKCEIEEADTIMSIQNGESTAVDVWVNWKGVNIGPARIGKNSMRSLGKTGYSDCDTASKNIYISKAKFPGGW